MVSTATACAMRSSTSTSRTTDMIDSKAASKILALSKFHDTLIKVYKIEHAESAFLELEYFFNVVQYWEMRKNETRRNDAGRVTSSP